MAALRLLVTGGAGFIGSGLVRHLLREGPHVEIINLDLLTYAGSLANLDGVLDAPGHTFVRGDICDGPLVREILDGVDVLFNLAAESHVDRSIREPASFVRTNVVGTRILLDAASAAGVSRFVQVSTDEVYGELEWFDPELADPRRSRFSEDTPLRPRSPYAASKASADLLALAYHETFGMDVVICRGSNNYGPRQHQEKLIPQVITRALRGEEVPLYGDGLHIRDWMFVQDFCTGIAAAWERGGAGRVYNFGGEAERTNLQVTKAVLGLLGAPEDLISFVPDRPGHDRRYAMDCARARRELGWAAETQLESGLADTVEWYRARLSPGAGS